MSKPSNKAFEYDFFQNIGMLRIDFVIHKKININNFFYSIYGNNGYVLKGVMEVSNLSTKDNVPSLFFNTRDNNIFFLKVKYSYSGENFEQTSFINLLQLRKKENINMNILDRSIEDLFKSIQINYDDSDSSDEENDSNHSEDMDNQSDYMNQYNTMQQINNTTDTVNTDNSGNNLNANKNELNDNNDSNDNEHINCSCSECDEEPNENNEINLEVSNINEVDINNI